MGRVKTVGLSVLSLIVISGAVGCATGGGDSGGVSRPIAAKPPLGAAAQADKGVASNEVGLQRATDQLGARSVGSAGLSAAPATALPFAGPRVVKTADLSVEVPSDDFHDSVRAATATAGRYGGFVVTTDVGGFDSRTGTVVVRIPASRFEIALSTLEDLGKVETETISGHDVTEEFIDLGARLRNFEAQERVLLSLMQDAQTIDETIRVQQQLQGVQLDIERLKGRLRFLRNQTSLGTITLTLTEKGAVVAATGPIPRAWNKAVDSFFGVVSAVIVGAGVVVPIALLALVALLVVRRLRPRLGL